MKTAFGSFNSVKVSRRKKSVEVGLDQLNESELLLLTRIV
jgi:hypothetical protein